MLGTRIESTIIPNQVGSNYTICCPRCGVGQVSLAPSPVPMAPAVIPVATKRKAFAKTRGRTAFNCPKCAKPFFINLVLVSVDGLQSVRLAFSI